MPEVWVISYYVAQSDTWMMQAVQGRDECRARMGLLCSQWPALQHVSALLQCKFVTR